MRVYTHYSFFLALPGMMLLPADKAWAHKVEYPLKNEQHICADKTHTPAQAGGLCFGLPQWRPTFSSPDGVFSASVGLVMHYDFGGFFSSSNQRKNAAGDLSGAYDNIRRARIPVIVRYGSFALNVTPDFAPMAIPTKRLYEANLTYSGIENTVFTLGYYQPRVTMADSESANDFALMERAAIVDQARALAAGDTRLGAGLVTHGERWYTGLNFTTQVLGTENTGLQQRGGAFRLAGRPIATPDIDLHLGLSASYAAHMHQGHNRHTYGLSAFPEVRLTTDQLAKTGTIKNVRSGWVLGPEFALRYKRLLFQAEYYNIHLNRAQSWQTDTPVSDLNTQGYYTELVYTAFGQPRAYKSAQAAFASARPVHFFNPAEGDWGALELALRWSVIDMNSHVRAGLTPQETGGLRGGRQKVIGLGVNWYPYDYMRVMLDYNHVMGDPSDTSAVNRSGRSVNVVAGRMQVGF